MEKRITISFTCGQLKEVEDALSMMKIFWSRAQREDKVCDIVQVLEEIKSQISNTRDYL